MIIRKGTPGLAVGRIMMFCQVSALPISALALVEFGDRSGQPKGVFNLVADPVATGETELAAKEIECRLLSADPTTFETVRVKQSADNASVSVELGRNARVMVFDAADIAFADHNSGVHRFRNCGRISVSPNRTYIRGVVFDTVAQSRGEAVSERRVGPGTASGVVTGPVIDEVAVTKAECHAAHATAMGASVMNDGRHCGPSG